MIARHSPAVREQSARGIGGWRKTGLVACCLASYLGFAIYQLPLPGLEYDEVIFAPMALGRTQDFLSPSAPVPLDSAVRFSPLAFNTFSLAIGSYSIPIMVVPYCGALKVYLLAAVFSLWDVSPWTIRLPNIVLGSLILIFFFQLFARLFSPLVALVALGFLVSDPSYIFYTRHDFNPSALVLLLVIVPLWCLVRWRETGKISLWAAAFFLLGLGLYNRLDYLWFLAAACITSLLYPPQALWSRLRKKEKFLAVICFVLGCAPFLFFVWQRPTIAASMFSLATPPEDFSAVARVKAYVLWTVVNGTSLYDFFSARSGINVGKEVTADGEVRVGSYAADKQPLLLASLFTGTLTPYFLLFVVGLLWFCHPPPALKALGVFLAVLLLCLLAVPGAVRGHHFVIFLPFVQAFLAAVLLFIREKARGRWVKIALVACGIALVGANLFMTLRYHRLLSATGGRGVWSEAIYDLTQYLLQRCQGRRCLIGDWGMGTQVVTLSKGNVAVEEIFWLCLQDGCEETLHALVQTGDGLFIFYTDRYVNFSRAKRSFYAAAQKANRLVTVERVFTERDGTPVIEVVRIGEKTR